MYLLLCWSQTNRRPTCKSDHLGKASGPPSARCRPLVFSYRSISARCIEGFPSRTSSRCPLSHRAVWRLKMAMGKQPAVFTERHNNLSVLSRRLMETAAEAVLFVSVQRKEEKKSRRGGGNTRSTHGRRVT